MKYRRLNLSNDVFMDFVYVPAGCFTMGNNKTIYDIGIDEDETPQQHIFLNDFLIGKYPVTNKQYQIFIQQTGYKVPKHLQSDGGIEGRENHPVVNVNLKDANSFCAWIRKTKKYNIRVPSEYQWEKAARGRDGRTYPWGEKFPNETLLNYRYVIRDTTEVGKYPESISPYGVFDMAGNVWEWTANYYALYPGCVYQRSPNYGENFFVIRGGSFASYENGVRCANREATSYEKTEPHIGFRCVWL